METEIIYYYIRISTSFSVLVINACSSKIPFLDDLGRFY